MYAHSPLSAWPARHDESPRHAMGVCVAGSLADVRILSDISHTNNHCSMRTVYDTGVML